MHYHLGLASRIPFVLPPKSSLIRIIWFIFIYAWNKSNLAWYFPSVFVLLYFLALFTIFEEKFSYFKRKNTLQGTFLVKKDGIENCHFKFGKILMRLISFSFENTMNVEFWAARSITWVVLKGSKCLFQKLTRIKAKNLLKRY